MRVCNYCHDSLLHVSSSRKSLKFSIANGFAIGQLPYHLREATSPEICLTSLASVRAPIFIARGGHHRVVHHHVIVFDIEPREVIDTLDHIIKYDDRILVIFTSPMTTVQQRAARKSIMLVSPC